MGMQMTMRAVSDGMGGIMHVPAPFVPRGKRKAAKPARATPRPSFDDLRTRLEHIERLEEEKQGITDDIKDVYAEASSTGFDVKTIRAIVALRRLDPEHRAQADALLEEYKQGIGL